MLSTTSQDHIDRAVERFTEWPLLDVAVEDSEEVAAERRPSAGSAS
jgi:hypothetical protein